MSESELHKQFLETAMNGDRLKMTELIRTKGCVPNSVRNNRGETALHIASRHGHITLVHFLIEMYDCSLEDTDYLGNSCFHTACLNGQIGVFMSMILISSLSPEDIFFLKGHRGKSVCYMACQSGSLPLVRLVAELSINFPCFKQNIYFDDHSSLLMHCVNDGEFYVDMHPFSISAIGLFEESLSLLLRVACQHGHLNIVKLFFNEFAYVFESRWYELLPTLLRTACLYSHINIVKYLHQVRRVNCVKDYNLNMPIFQRHKQDQNFASRERISANEKRTTVTMVDTELHIAALSGNIDLLEYLLNDCECTDPHLLVGKNKDTLLHSATVSDNTALVELLISFKCDVNAVNEHGDSVLHSACRWGSVNIVKFFVTSKLFTNINLTNKKGESPFLVALYTKNYEVCYFLIKCQDCDVNIQTNVSKETALHLACSTDNYDIIDCILKKGCHCQNVVDAYGDTPLFNACRISSLKIIKLLLSNGCNPFIVNRLTKETPAHIACRLQNLFVLATFMETYSDDLRNQQNLLSKSLLHYACINDASEIVEYLVENNLCDVNLANENGETALHLAIPRNFKTTKLLVNVPQQKSFEIGDINGNTVLHYACKLKAYEIVMLISERNRLPHMQSLCSITNKRGLTPLHVAIINGALNIVEIFLNNEFCERTQTSEDGTSPLHFACSHGHTDIIVHLIGGDFMLLNSKGETPLYCALKNYHFDLAKFILSQGVYDCQRPVMVMQVTSDDPMAYLLSMISYCIHKTLKQISFPLLHSLFIIIVTLKREYRYGDVSTLKKRYDGLIDMLRHVVSHGMVSIFDEDSSLNSILHVLSSYSKGYEVCRDMLNVLPVDFIKRSCGASFVNSCGDSPLHVASYTGNVYMIKWLLESNLVSISCKNADGKTPIQIARDVSIIDYLVSQGANPNKIRTSNQYRFILDQFKNQHRDSLPLSVGVVVLGNSQAGKTSLVNYLTDNKNIQSSILDKDGSTVGVVKILYKIKGVGSFTFYDTGGQPEFHSMNSAYLQSLFQANTPLLVVLVVDCSLHDDKILRQIRYWLSHLKIYHSSTSTQQMTLLIGSHGDCLRQDNYKKKVEILNKAIEHAADIQVSEKPMFLDCRNPTAEQKKALLQFLKGRYSLINKQEMDIRCYSLFSYLCEWFPGKDPVKVSAVRKRIKTCRNFERIDEGSCYCSGTNPTIPIPYAIGPLVELLKSLQARQHLILLEISDDNLSSEDYWILTNTVQSAVYEKVVETLFAPESFGNTLWKDYNVGVIPSSAICARITISKLDFNAMMQFLIYSEFCAKIEDHETLILLQSGNVETSHEEHTGLDCTLARQFQGDVKSTPQQLDSEKHKVLVDQKTASKSLPDRFYFFPGLVSSDKVTDLWIPSSDYSYNCGWYLECCPGEFLTPRFIQVLLLRLVFKFAVKQGSSSEKGVTRKCKIWRNGVFWGTMKGVEVLVEVLEQNTAVIVLIRCLEYQEMEAVLLRSSVIRQVNDTRKKYCYGQKLEEYFLHPDYVSKTSSDSLSDLRSQPKISMLQIIQSIKDGEPCVLDSEHRPVKLTKLLHFESYSGLYQKLFWSIFDVENAEKDIPEQVLDEIALLTFKAGSQKDQIVFMLQFPIGEIAKYEEMEPYNIQRQFFLMFCNAIPRYKDLQRCFNNFTIFSGRSHLISGMCTSD